MGLRTLSQRGAGGPSEGDGMDVCEEADPSGLPWNLDRGGHPGVGPLSPLGGSEQVVTPQPGRAILSSGCANHACRRVEEVLKYQGPDLDLILDLWEDP
jgi:hypothetical protein